MAERVVQGAAGVEPQQWRAGAAALVASQYRRQVWEEGKSVEWMAAAGAMMWHLYIRHNRGKKISEPGKPLLNGVYTCLKAW